MSIYLPQDLVGLVVANEDLLRERGIPAEVVAAAPAPTVAAVTTPSTSAASTTTKRYHTVRRGESLGKIAGRYRLSVSELKRMNGLRGDTIRPGQKLVVGKKTVTASAPAPAEPVPTEGSFIYHVVQPGDTLWDIAKRYPGVSVDDLKRLNAGQLDLKPGDRIKVSKQEG